MLLVLRPENQRQTWDPRAKFRVLYRIELKVGGSAVRAPTSAQLAGSASVLVRVCPLTPTRCNPVAFGFKTRESASNLGPPGPKFRVLYRIELKLEDPPFEPPTSAQLAGSASVLVRVCPLTPTRCNPVAFGLRPENQRQTWDPRANFVFYIVIELKVGGSAVRAPDLGPTSGKCQCAGQGVPSNAY